MLCHVDCRISATGIENKVNIYSFTPFPSLGRIQFRDTLRCQFLFLVSLAHTLLPVPGAFLVGVSCRCRRILSFLRKLDNPLFQIFFKVIRFPLPSLGRIQLSNTLRRQFLFLVILAHRALPNSGAFFVGVLGVTRRSFSFLRKKINSTFPNFLRKGLWIPTPIPRLN